MVMDQTNHKLWSKEYIILLLGKSWTGKAFLFLCTPDLLQGLSEWFCFIVVDSPAGRRIKGHSTGLHPAVDAGGMH